MLKGSSHTPCTVKKGEFMGDIIIYRHWQPGDDDAVLAFLPNTNEDWYRHKFEAIDDRPLEPEGIRLAFYREKVVGHAMGEFTTIFIENRVQKFGTVSAVYVDPNMRRRGIATSLMQDLHAYFEMKGCRGSILETDTDEARRLYLKIGYQQVTRELLMEIQPEEITSQLRWTETHTEDLSILHQLDKSWASNNFPVPWIPEIPNVDIDYKDYYRVLRHGKRIIGYGEWSEPSQFSPHGSIRDPVVPNVSPMDVIRSVQAVILAPMVWKTAEGSWYEKSLCSLGCSAKPISAFTLFLSFGSRIDLTKHYRSI